MIVNPRKTKVVNLLGGPGCGKSTTAAGLYHALKKRDITCEYVSEFAKDIVWEETNTLLKNQIYIFAEQLRRQWRLLNKVDYIVTDSPLLLSGIYYRYYNDSNDRPLFSQGHSDLTVKFFEATFHEFDNVNFYINRKKKYQPTGRLQTEDEAKVIDRLVMTQLHEMDLDYHTVNYDNATEEILAVLGIQ